MHSLLAKTDDLDAAIGNSADLTAQQVDYFRGTLRSLRADMAGVLDAPAPGSTTIVGGATITHRPDIAHTERARQAAEQSDAGYLPVREALRKGAA